MSIDFIGELFNIFPFCVTTAAQQMPYQNRTAIKIFAIVKCIKQPHSFYCCFPPQDVFARTNQVAQNLTSCD
jgi:hypothetical protein